MTDYQPLSEREKPESDRAGLAEGVPPWLRSSLAAWIMHPLEEADKRNTSGVGGVLQEIERNARIQPALNFSGSFPDIYAKTDLENRVKSGDEDMTLNVLDYIVGESPSSMAEQLANILHQGGSVWTIGSTPSGCLGLIRRVDATMQQAADQAMSGGQQHHKYLRKAWGEAYGRNPSPDSAYTDAVKAVEAVSIPVVRPLKKPETLGLVIVELRDHPEKFATRLVPSSSPPDSVTVVREMLQLLWKSQWDRHGVDDTSVPLTVTQEEAEDALSLAVTLVRWFGTGAIHRKATV